MDYECETGGGCFRNVFRTFVCISLSLLLGLQAYVYLWGSSQDTFEGGLSDIKYVVMQLTRGLSEVNHKHEKLQSEMERISTVMPAVAAAAGRAKDALQPTLACKTRQALDVLNYDRQIADYALESAGARVLDTGDTLEHVIYESPVGWALHAITSVMCRQCYGARAMISPGTLPGECWAFKGSKGEALIRLLGTIHVTGVSVEHIPPNISPTGKPTALINKLIDLNGVLAVALEIQPPLKATYWNAGDAIASVHRPREISSAPRLFQLEGLEYRSDTYAHDFGTFEYNKDGKPIQYFEVLNPSLKPYNLVRIRVITNWGHSVYTCVYRVRVHGQLVSSGQIFRNAVAEEAELRIENE